MTLLRYVAMIFLAILAFPSGVKADEAVRLDPSCADVNKAYGQSNRPWRYSISTYQLKEDGSLKQFQDLQVDGDLYYQKYSFSNEWQARGRISFSILDRTGPRFTSCKLTDRKDKLVHYSAKWHDFPYSAEAELWITRDSHQLIKMVRRYPDSRWEFPFAAAVEIYDYGEGSLAGSMLRPDPTCSDINNAYRQRSRPTQYSIMTYQVKDDRSLKPYAATRITKDGYYTKYSFSDKWMEHGPPFFSIMDRYGPKFTSCKLVGQESSASGGLLHYSAMWHGFPHIATAEVWIDARNHRLIKMLRHYPDKSWEYPFGTALELYDYNPVQALLTAEGMPGNPTSAPPRLHAP